MKYEDSRLRNIFMLSKYLKHYTFRVIVSIGIGLFYRILPILASFVLAYVIGLFTSGRLNENYYWYFGILLLLVVLRAAGRYADTWFSHDVAYKILAEFRIKLYHKTEQLSPAFLKNNRSGNILAVMMEDVDILEWFYAHTFGIVIITGILLAATLIFLAFLHPLLMLDMLFWIALLFLTHLVLKRRSEKDGRDVRNCLGTLEAEVADGINGIKDIVSLNWENGYKARVAAAKQNCKRAGMHDSVRKGCETGISKAIMELATVTILVITVYLVHVGKLSSIWYLVTVTVSTAVWGPLSELMALTSQFGLISAAAGRVFRILEEEPNVKETGSEVCILPNAFEIEFDHVGFTYPGESSAALQEISFTVNSGETVALAGASGSGKSTIVNLLQRFYEFGQGDIRINGKSIRRYTLDSLRSQLAVVPQDVYLFNSSIWENLKISNEKASDTEILKAIEDAGADGFISEMPEGLKTMVGERGARLSGGQKQRLAIARALVRNSRILILDEASSNLDSCNEAHLNSALCKLSSGRTTLIIAHRLSTLQSADRIIFIRNGRVDDIGTFAELEANNAAFKEVMGGTIQDENS